VEQVRLKSERTTSEIYRKTIGLGFVKRATGMSSGLLRVQIEPQQRNNTSTTTGNCVHILNSQQIQNPIKVAERKKI
jgi:hypothetical protein